MADVILVRHDIEQGKTDRAIALFEEMAQMDDEAAAVEVLQKEGVYTESAFVHHAEDDDSDSILYYIEAEDGQQVYDVFKRIEADPEAEAEGVSEYVRELADVMDGDPYVAEEFDVLYHFVNPERP